MYRTIIFALLVIATSCGNKPKVLESADNDQIAEASVKEVEAEKTIDQEAVTLKIKELVENMEKYADQIVQLSGTVTKVNANIMGKNWVHLQDGSKDDYDMVITTTEDIYPEDEVTMQGKVTLDKDFGGGYIYEIIVEEGVIVK